MRKQKRRMTSERHASPHMGGGILFSYKNSINNLKGRDHLEDQRSDERIILNWILKK
jgi:hypothetical protein